MQAAAITTKAVIAEMVTVIRYVLTFIPVRYMHADPRIPAREPIIFRGHFSGAADAATRPHAWAIHQL